MHTQMGPSSAHCPGVSKLCCCAVLREDRKAWEASGENLEGIQPPWPGSRGSCTGSPLWTASDRRSSEALPGISMKSKRSSGTSCGGGLSRGSCISRPPRSCPGSQLRCQLEATKDWSVRKRSACTHDALFLPEGHSRLKVLETQGIRCRERAFRAYWFTEEQAR